MREPALTAALVLLLGVARGAPGEQPPELVRAGGSLMLRRLPAVLSEPRTARQLDTGLTTSFVFAVAATAADQQPIRGEAQVRVRYDLWDERYVVERLDHARDSPATATLPRRELPAWWSTLTLAVRAPDPALLRGPLRARVELLVVPFSQAEQRDAQDWLLRSFAPPGGSAGSPESARGVADSRLRAFYGALLAASIGRRSLVTHSWTVPVVSEPR